MMDLEDVQAFEERGFNAWPTRRSVSVGGWLCRLGDRYTNRANSINARAMHPSFEGVLPFAERLYRTHGLPPVFRLSPLAAPEADAVLDEAGYGLYSPTSVLTGPVTRQLVPPEIRLETAPSAGWLASFSRLSELSEHDTAAHAAIVRSIRQPAAFASVRCDGDAVGCGLAVYERGAVGLFDLVIAEQWRSKGLGRAMIGALTSLGAGLGAKITYLQVAEANHKALRLYDRLGFRPAYGYHYRLPPERV